MVRLKDRSSFHGIIINYISIPYGAIKSVIKFSFFEQLAKFQFLMVRLKEK